MGIIVMVMAIVMAMAIVIDIIMVWLYRNGYDLYLRL